MCVCEEGGGGCLEGGVQGIKESGWLAFGAENGV